MNKFLTSLYVVAILNVAAQAEPYGDIPLDTTGPRPTALLSVDNAEPVVVIFDTGAGGSVLSTEMGKKHHLPDLGPVRISSPGAANSLPAFRSKLPSARLGNADISGAMLVVAELGVPLPGISGVMSPNLFKGSLVRFELSKSRVIVQPKSPSTLPQSASFPFHGAHPLPAMNIDIAGVVVSAHLDTGSGFGLSLPLETADRFPLIGELVATKPARMAGGERKAFSARINGTVRIGPITLIQPDVMFIERFQYANVGFPILKDWTIVLDPQEHRTWLLAP